MNDWEKEGMGGISLRCPEMAGDTKWKLCQLSQLSLSLYLERRPEQIPRALRHARKENSMKTKEGNYLNRHCISFLKNMMDCKLIKSLKI